MTIKSDIVEKVIKRKAVYLREGSGVNNMKNLYPHLSLGIADDYYMPVLIGFPINQNKTKSRMKIYKMFVKFIIHRISLINLFVYQNRTHF